jgi:DNA-binding transcriptional MocR family regulator
MPDENKKEIVNILSENNIPLIEDDVYGDLYFGSTALNAVNLLIRMEMYCIAVLFQNTGSGISCRLDCSGKI